MKSCVQVNYKQIIGRFPLAPQYLLIKQTLFSAPTAAAGSAVENIMFK